MDIAPTPPSTPTPSPPVPAMQLALDANFGAMQRWHDDFVERAAACDGATQTLCLAFDPQAGTLVNASSDDAAGAPGLVPLLEFAPAAPATAAHARREHIDAGMRGIDWAVVYERYQHAVHAASAAFGATQADVDGALLLDVRRAGVFEQAPTQLPGARWHDPAAVSTWGAALPRDRPVLVYCVYGHEVGRATALRLRAAGVDARYLQGGIDGWQAAGLPLAPRSTEGDPR